MRPFFCLVACAIALACDPRASLPRPSSLSAPPSHGAEANAAPRAVPPERPVVPHGCEINLGGKYRLAGKPVRRYLAEDDGAHLVVRPLSVPDAGPDETMIARLDRTPKGLVGTISGSARTVGGAVCPVAFKAEIVACGPDALTLRSEDATDIDDRCRARPVEGSVSEKMLIRE